MLPNRYLTGELHGVILKNNLVTFARQHFRGNYRYQYDNATPHRAWVVFEFLQQGYITKMEQLTRSPDCNSIEHIWDELDHAITSMDNSPQNLGEFRRALLDKWAEIAVKCLQCLAARMPRCLVLINAARGGNIRYWSNIHKTISTDSIMQKFKFVWLDLPQ